jgi:hypothetical protein
MADPFAEPPLPPPDATAPIDAILLAKLEAAASKRGIKTSRLLDTIVREAL